MKKNITLNESQLNHLIKNMVREAIMEFSNNDETPCELSDEERLKVKNIVERMGEAETTLRDCFNELRLSLPMGCESFEFDGEVITMGQIENWERILEEIDRFCYYV